MTLLDPKSERPAIAPRYFAIVPAAGRSRRMGQAKLLLPWGDRSIIEKVLDAWRASAVAATVVVLHADDVQLAEVCRQAGAEVVVPTIPPPDMKASIARALEHLESNYEPRACDAWLVAPADMPGLTPELIQAVIQGHRDDWPPAHASPLTAGRGLGERRTSEGGRLPVSAVESRPDEMRIVVPIVGQRRGHPVLFPWMLSHEVAGLAPDEGLKAIVERHATREIAWHDAQAFADVDSPEDYRRLKP